MSLYIDNYDIVYLTKKFKNGKEQKGYNVESHINGKNVHDLKKIIPLAESFLDTNKNAADFINEVTESLPKGIRATIEESK